MMMLNTECVNNENKKWKKNELAVRGEKLDKGGCRLKW